MSAYLYEKVLVDKLQEITGDRRIRVISPDTSLMFLAQADKDKVKYPAVVLSRGAIELSSYRNQVAALKGQTTKIDKDNIITKAQLIPMRINWNIDVFTVDRYSCDEIIRELIFYFITHPRFYLNVPYGLDICQNFDIFVESEIQDNSDLADFNNRGEYFRETFSIYTDNAHLFTSHKQYPTYIDPIDVVDMNNQNN